MGKDMSLIPSEQGKYDYEWVDPSDPRAAEVKTVEIVDSVGDRWEENLLIAGDSGDALRALSAIPEWADQYRGKVKLAYIDPPFNTEQAFEHYADQLEHSVWLTMMRDRIRNIKPLLSADASIWVHLDDAEVHRMRVLLDEEFGPDNFIATIAWQKVYAPKNSAKHLSVDQDYVLVYAVNAEQWRPNELVRSASMDAAYKNPDNDPRGPWKPGDLLANKPYSLGRYQIITPSGRVIDGPPPGRYWRISHDKLRELDADNRIYWGADGSNVPALKRFLSEVRGAVPRTMWFHTDVGHNQTGKNEIQALFPGEVPFSTPKPERLLERVLSIASNPGDIVLDCFAGSGTTPAVAHKMGRRWVAVELLESTVKDFIVPRLAKVVNGLDAGGISMKKERVAVDELPEGITPEEARQFTTLLGKVSKSVTGLDDKTLSALRTATRTKDQTTVQWTGGGGFTIARMGLSLYEVDDQDDAVYLSEAAVNGVFARAVAGQLGFRFETGDQVFCGRKGRIRLAVIDGIADENVVRTVASSLADEEKAVVVAKGVVNGMAELMRTLSPGSRIRKAPDDLFAKGTIK
ncbi:site-specific DNA-methyltransferase [Zafaria cholistanensis]|nr:site-specific DNA-methyltransferase [Zafaria cholistanensis]